MEVLAALSVASAVVSFIDFGSKLVSKVHELRESSDGLDEGTSDIKLVAKTLSRLSHELEVSSTAASPEEREMKELATRCKDLVKQLLAVIAKLESGGQQMRRWSSFRQAIRFAMSKDQIIDLTKRIESLRQSMNMCLLKMIS
jgi:hypothetical protein